MVIFVLINHKNIMDLTETILKVFSLNGNVTAESCRSTKEVFQFEIDEKIVTTADDIGSHKFAMQLLDELEKKCTK